MLSILEQLEEALAGFPEDSKKLCSAHVDPNPLLQFAQQVHRGVELCRVSLRYYHKPDPQLEWEEPEVRDRYDPERILRPRKRSKPWSDHSYDQWCVRRDRLIRLMVAHHDSLIVEYEDMAALRNPDVGRKRYRPLDMLYVLSAHVLLCCVASKGAPKKEAHKSPHVEPLLIHPGEPSKYTISQLLGSLKWLCARWKELPYHSHLVDYLFQLEYRAAQLLVYSDSSQIHDLEDYRREAGPRLYAPNDFLLNTLSALSVGLHEDLLSAQCLPWAERGKWPLKDGMVDAVRQWFLARARKMSVKTASPWVREKFLLMSLQPGEKDMYQLENPREGSPTAMQILRKHRDDRVDATEDIYVIKGRRGVMFTELIRQANVSPSDVLIEAFGPKGNAKETLMVQLSMVEMITQEALKEWEVDFAEYCTLEMDLAAQFDAVQAEPLKPRLMQIFHHWQLVYKGRIYWMNNLVETLCAWFLIISHERPSLNPDIPIPPFQLSDHPNSSTEPLAIEIFRLVPWCRQKWWPRGPPGEEDEEVMRAAGKGLVF